MAEPKQWPDRHPEQIYTKFLSKLKPKKKKPPVRPEDVAAKMTWSDDTQCWTCKICQKIIRSKVACNRHVRKDCANKQPENPSWQLGWMRVQGQLSHGCRYCKQTFSKRRGIRRHLQLRMCTKMPDWNKMLGTGKPWKDVPGAKDKKGNSWKKGNKKNRGAGLLGPVPNVAAGKKDLPEEEDEEDEEDEEEEDEDEEEEEEDPDMPPRDPIQTRRRGQLFGGFPLPGQSSDTSQVGLSSLPGCAHSQAQWSERVLASYSRQGSQDQVTRNLDTYMFQRQSGMDGNVGLPAWERTQDGSLEQSSERILAHYSDPGSQDQFGDLDARMFQRPTGRDRDVGLLARENSRDFSPAHGSQRILAQYSGQGSQHEVNRDLDAHMSQRHRMDRNVGLPARERSFDQAQGYGNHGSSEYLRQGAESEAEERNARQINHTGMLRPDSYPFRQWPKEDVRDRARALPDRPFHTSHRETSDSILSQIQRERRVQTWSDHEDQRCSVGNPQEQYNQYIPQTQGSGSYSAPSQSGLTGYQQNPRMRDPDRREREVMSDRAERSERGWYNSPGRKAGFQGDDMRRMPATERREWTGRFAEDNQSARRRSLYQEGGSQRSRSPGGRSRSPVRQRETVIRSEFSSRYSDTRTHDWYRQGYERNMQEESSRRGYQREEYSSRTQMAWEYTGSRDRSYRDYQSDRDEGRRRYNN